jgi:hypothetical protein
MANDVVNEMEAFCQLFGRFLEIKEKTGSKVQERPRQSMVRSPRSGMAQIKVSRHIKPSIQGRKLYFGCPVCQRTTWTWKNLAGKDLRCRECTAAIKAPCPGRQIAARTRENDVRSLCSKDHFPTPGEKRLQIPNSVSAALSCLVVGAFFMGITKFARMAAPPAYQLVPVAVGVENDAGPAANDSLEFSGHTVGRDLKKDAENLVKRFLAGVDLKEKSRYVRDSRRVRPLMEDYYADPAHLHGQPTEITAIGTGYFDTPGDTIPVTDVLCEYADGSTAVFYVEQGEHPRIEWESSVGYVPSDWKQMAGEGTLVQMRVLVTRSDYYNHEFSDGRDNYYCLKMRHPVTGELLGYGYAPKEDSSSRELWFKAPLDSDLASATPCRLEIQGGLAEKNDPFRITRLVSMGLKQGNDASVAAR